MYKDSPGAAALRSLFGPVGAKKVDARSRTSTLGKTMSNGPATDDTIAAISTPPGRGGIGIVRLSGAEARRIVEELVQLKQPLEPGRARLADVMDEADFEAEESEGRGGFGRAADDHAGRIDEALVVAVKVDVVEDRGLIVNPRYFARRHAMTPW